MLISKFHNSIKTDYIFPNEIRDFHEASVAIENAFKDYNEFSSHACIDYLPPREFRRKFMDDPEFRKRFGVEEMEVTLDER